MRKSPLRRSAVSLLLLTASLVAVASAEVVAADDMPVPGGPAAIRRLLGLDPDRPRETFFLELHEVLLAGAESRSGWTQVERRRAVVEFAEDLEDWRRRFGGRTILSVSSPEAWARTLRALEWLGLEVDGSPEDFSTEGREDREALRRRSFPDAIGTPMAVLLTRLRAGEQVVLAASDETAPLPFGLAAWREMLGQPDLTAPAVFLELVRNVPASRLLVALHGLDPETRVELAILSRRLRGKGGATALLDEELLGALSRFPGSLALSGGAFLLPGGKPAEPIWTDVFGVSPSKPAEFLRALLSTDGGKGAYVVDAIQQLREPVARALLFGPEGSRESPVARFRRLYRSIERMGEGFAAGHRDPYDFAHLALFLAPDRWALLALAADLDGDSFPSTEAELAKLVSGARRGGSRPAADDGLIRLLRREGDRSSGSGALRRFVFVSSLAAGRPELEEPATFALLLRGADRFFPAYAVLEDMALPAELVRKYLFALDGLDRRERSRDTEVACGLFQAAVELTAQLHRAESLTSAQAARLLGALLDLPAFARVGNAAPRSARPDVLGWVSDGLLGALGAADAPAGAPDSVDEVLTRALVGRAPAVVFPWRGGNYRFDPAEDEARRRLEFREKQRLASLDDVRAAGRARARLAEGARSGESAALREAAAELEDRLSLAFEESEGRGEDDDRLRDRAARALEAVRALARPSAAGAARSVAGFDDLDAVLAERLLEALLVHVYAASAGDPNDLYYEDPNFVRRHSFRAVERSGRLSETPFSPTRLISTSGGGGARVSGSVFGLPDVLGLLHADQITYGPGASLINEQIRSGLVGAVRRVSVARLDDDALKFVEASCRATEELAAALAPKDASDRLRFWTEIARDLVPRARLALVAGSSVGAAQDGALSANLSPSELYRIGRRLSLGAAGADVPVSEAAVAARDALAELEKRVGRKGSRDRLAELGPRAVAYAGKFRLTDFDLPPYERLAGYRLPGLFSDRLYDFKITVARVVAQANLPAAILPLVLPAALDEMMGGLTMAFAYDWRSIVRRSQRFGAADLDRFLEEALSAGRLSRDHSRDEAAGGR